MINRSLVPWVVIAGLLVAGSVCLADTNQLKVQSPWAYMKRSEGPAKIVDYMATTSAMEDRDTFLVLVCTKDEQISAAIIRTDAFPYRLGQSLLQLSLRLDDLPAVSVAAAPIEPKQLTIHPQMARELVPLIVHSKTMSASVPEVNGSIHTYNFSLQPNDLALREIGLHCYHPGT